MALCSAGLCLYLSFLFLSQFISLWFESLQAVSHRKTDGQSYWHKKGKEQPACSILIKIINLHLFTFMHLADAFIQSDYIASSYSFTFYQLLINMCLMK